MRSGNRTVNLVRIRRRRPSARRDTVNGGRQLAFLSGILQEMLREVRHYGIGHPNAVRQRIPIDRQTELDHPARD
jgi:hypothetical protein